MKPVFFATPEDLRAWFQANTATAPELWVGFYKRASRRPSVTWPESVDEALCVGWIDGIRKKLDHESYTIRFTPRRRGSTWSTLNIQRVELLARQQRMQPAGLLAFANRRDNKSGIYSYEERTEHLPESYLSQMRKQPSAWKFFHAQPPSYRKTAVWWVVSAKQEATRQRRLEKLIAGSAQSRRLF